MKKYLHAALNVSLSILMMALIIGSFRMYMNHRNTTPSEPHPTPTISFGNGMDSGFYRLEATDGSFGEPVFVCDGKEWKAMTDLTKEEFLAIFGSGSYSHEAFKDICMSMKTIKVVRCNCGEDIYEDDRPQGGSVNELMCIGCGRSWRRDQLQEVEIADIKSEEIE